VRRNWEGEAPAEPKRLQSVIDDAITNNPCYGF